MKTALWILGVIVTLFLLVPTHGFIVIPFVISVWSYVAFRLGRRRPIQTFTPPAQLQQGSRHFARSIKRAAMQRAGHRCQFCGSSARDESGAQYLEYDHIIPWSQGGPSTLENCQILCRACNQRKGNANRR